MSTTICPSLQPITIYAHGIVDGPQQINRFISAFATQHDTVAFDDCKPCSGYHPQSIFSNIVSKVLGKNLNFSYMYMGQGPDIEKIARKVAEYSPNQPLILYGCSRGASAIINFMAQHNPQFMAQHNPQNVVALVLDAVPADMPATLHPFLKKYYMNPAYAESIFRLIFPAYPKNVTQPIDAIKQIANKNLAILLIHSATDARVPAEHSVALHEEFCKHGFCNVKITILPNGKHSFLLQDPAIAPVYLHTVHSFYQTNNLPFVAKHIHL